jgi:multidrug efflux system outer membrane protein
MAKLACAKFFITFSASLLAGCSMIPAYERPALPVAAVWPDSAQANASASSAPAAADIEWQSFFADPALRRLIDAALFGNRDLRIAVLNIEQARAQADIRRADQFPTVNAALSGSRQFILLPCKE